MKICVILLIEGAREQSVEGVLEIREIGNGKMKTAK